MITETLLLVACGLFIASHSPSTSGPGASRETRRADAALRAAERAALRAIRLAEAQAEQRLHVPGTTRLLRRDRRFLRGLGLDPARIDEIRVYATPGALDTFPVPLRECVESLFAQGRCRGPGLAALATGARELRIGEQLYIARVAPARGGQADGEPELVAFVDRVRL